MRDQRAAAAVQAVPEDVRFLTFHLISPGGIGYSGGDAVVETLRSVRATSWLGRLLSHRSTRILVRASYAGLVKSKGFLGRFVRDAPGPVRWP